GVAGLGVPMDAGMPDVDQRGEAARAISHRQPAASIETRGNPLIIVERPDLAWRKPPQDAMDARARRRRHRRVAVAHHNETVMREHGCPERTRTRAVPA